jgi:glycosyltransferase involved in cell wall biosynthesis
MGLENLIQAVASLRDRLPQLRLIIVGIGELESDLKALVNGLGVTNRVFFAGKVSEMDLPSYYQAADLFVLPTRALEGFGMVTLEALASGTPVLGTPVGGTVEILNRLNPDLLFADASPEAMAAKIGDFATSGKLTPRLRQACRDYALKHYSWDAVVAQYEALCRKLRDGTR